MTPRAKRAYNLASYHRRMADPAFREARARRERERWANGDGARRNAINRAKNAKFRAIRLASPPPARLPRVPREAAPDRVAQKRAWRRAHAAELNTRREANRMANPGKYRAREKAFRRRRKKALASQLFGAVKNHKSLVE